MVEYIPVLAKPEQGNAVVIDFTGLGVVDGDVLVWSARSQGTITADITPPLDWARAGTLGSVPTPGPDRFLGSFFKPVPTVAGATLTATFTGVSGGGNSRIMSELGIIRGADLAHLNDGGLKFQASAVIASVNAVATPYLVLAIWGAEFTAGNSVIPSATPAGYDVESITQTAGGVPATVLDNSVTNVSRTGLVVVSKAIPAGGSLTVPSLTTTWAGTATDPKSASWIVRGLAVTPPIGTPIKLGNGAAARLSYLDGSGVRKAPTSVSLWLPGFNDVNALLAKSGATMAHRGGSLDWPEMAEVAYDRAVRRGYGALEFSCGWTSDLIPFGLGSQYLDSMAGVTGNVDPTTMTWATLAATYVNKSRPVVPGVFQPFYRLEQFLAKYTPTHTVLVDPKFGWSTTAKINAMLDICDANGGPSKIVIKFDAPVDWAILVDAAKLRGYKTMNYWGIEVDKLTTEYLVDKWDLIGVRYDADQAMYDTASSFGKPVWGAVIPDQAGYNTAATRGADLMMCSSVTGIAPVR